MSSITFQHAVAMDNISSQNVAPEGMPEDKRDRRYGGLWPTDGDAVGFLAEFVETKGDVLALQVLEAGLAQLQAKKAGTFADKAGGKVTDAKVFAFLQANAEAEPYKSLLRGGNMPGAVAKCREALGKPVVSASDKDVDEETKATLRSQHSKRKKQSFAIAEKRDAERLAKHSG